MVEVLLVSRSGGGPTDYQLLEEEDDAGRAQLRLLVHPRVPRFDADAMADAFLEGLAAGSAGGKRMALLWREAGLLVVERRPPIATAAGKLRHLHHGGRRPGPPSPPSVVPGVPAEP